MTYRWPGLLLGILLLAVQPACGADNGLPPPDGATPSVQFDEPGVLAAPPSQAVVIGLTATNVSTVTLSLAGNYLDAVLDTDSVTIDPSTSQGSFVLHTPQAASTFSVLAVAGGNATARLDVAVSATGFATVQVTVDYEGTRPVPLVDASAFVQMTCAAVGTSAAPDGSPLVAQSPGDPLAIQSVPTDGSVAIKVRIAHYAVGCVDIPSLTPDVTHDVTVHVYDLPLDLTDSTLETRFTFTPTTYEASALGTYFGGVSSTVLAASFPSTTNEAGELLDAMAKASTSPTAFASARTSGAWDTVTQGWLGVHPPTMNARAGKWLQDALQAGIGDMTGHLAGNTSNPLFTPKTLGSLDATTAGLTAPTPFSWSGEPADVLSINGSVVIVPSQLACALADLQAHADVPTSTGTASAIAIGIDCTGLGKGLVPTGYAYGTCDATCVAGLCTTALTNMWSAGSASLDKPIDAVTLAITAAAPAVVGDTANVTSYIGGWVGAFTQGTTTVGAQGIAKGAYGTVPN